MQSYCHVKTSNNQALSHHTASTSHARLISRSGIMIAATCRSLCRTALHLGLFMGMMLTLDLAFAPQAQAQAPTAVAEVLSPLFSISGSIAAPSYAHSGVTITLDGSKSSDPQSKTLTYAWTQQSPGTAVTLSSATVVSPTFTTPERISTAQQLVFQLIVTNGDNMSSSNVPPAGFISVTIPAKGSILVAAAPIISISPATVTVTAGTAIADITIDASAGGAVASYSIMPAITNGLSFDASTGTISGTPTAAANEISYTITATNTGGTDTATVAITVNAAPIAAPMISITPATVTATAGTAIADITIDASAGGAVASYSIMPAITNGLSFDASTGTISGTPTAAANEISYTITATNASDTDTATVAITVNAAPVAVAAPIISITPATVTVTAGTAIADITIDASAGGAVASYSIMPAITNGLSFDASTGAISGTPTAAANEISYTITATNASDTDTATVAITVEAAPVAVAAPIISITPATVTVAAGTAITPITIASTGGTVASYSIMPAITNGLSFDASTGTISGTPTAAAPEISYTITATNASDTDTATVAITVEAAAVAVAAPIISITPATVTVTAGTAIADITIDASAGGAVASYSIMPAITNGLSFDASTGTISGTPGAAAAAVTYTITATNTGGTATAMVTITVVDAPDISASVPTLIATQAVAITPITIINTGGAVLTNGYSIDPAIGNGLSFDTSSGSISGTPTAVADAVTYTITANGVGMPTVTATATVVITVNAATPTLAAPIISISLATVTATAGTAITDITITSTGGAVASYSIDPPIANELTFDTSTGTISGTPGAAAAAVTYTITATNTGGTATATVAITVNAAPATPDISISPATVTVTAGTAIADIAIDASAGGAVASYSIMPAITNGLSFDASTGTISGTPGAAAAAVTYTITATNTGGTATATVAITVNAAPVAVAAPIISITPATVTVTAGTAIADITIDASAGGAVASYSIDPPIANGLSFDASTGTISGTPTAAANEISYTITATNASDTDTATVAITVNAAPATPDISISPATVTAIAGAAITDITITSTGGAVASYSIDPPIANELTFDTSTGTISGTPGAAAAAVTYTITASNASGSDTATVAITFGLTPTLAKTLNEAILPRLIHTMLASTMTALSHRVDAAFSAVPQTANLSLDGQMVRLDSQAHLSANLQDMLQGKLPAYIKSLQNDTMDWQQLLSNSSFVMPLNAGGKGGFGSAATVWGTGDYSNLSDKGWKGDVFSIQLGIDGHVCDDLLAGGLVSWSKGDVDYTLDKGGEYTHQITSVHPYMVRSSGNVNLWGSVGYGQGKLEIKQSGDAQRSSNTRLLSLSTGVTSQLLQSGLSLKSDLALAQINIDGSTDNSIASQKLASQRLRLLLEIAKERRSASGLFKPVMEVGVRYDGGDGESGVGAVLDFGLHYACATTGWTVEGKVHTLVGRKDYKEWGVQGQIHKQAGVGGQGLSFSMSPSYGNNDSGADKVWQQQLPAVSGDNGNSHGGSARLDVNMGYGLFTGGGLLTPYIETTLGKTDRHRFGLRWKNHSRLDMNLFAEEQAGEYKVLLKSRIRF